MPNISSSLLLPINGQLGLNEVIKTSKTRSYLLTFNYFKKTLLVTNFNVFKTVVFVSKNIQLLEEQLNSQVHILKRQYHIIA